MKTRPPDMHNHPRPCFEELRKLAFAGRFGMMLDRNF